MRLFELNESMGISTAGLAQKGYNVREMLYHGSFWDFSSFTDVHKGTSKYLFTTPQKQTADTYGRYLYTCYARQDKQVDLRSNRKVVEKVIRANIDAVLERHRFQLKSKREDARKEEAFRYGVKYLSQHGPTYNGGDDLQNDIISECFGLGFTSIRTYDCRPGVSVIFKNREDVIIVRKEVDGIVTQF